MNHHRFHAIMDPPDPFNGVPPAPQPGAFLVWPVVPGQEPAGAGPSWPQLLYYLAFQQAQAVSQPSLLQRQLSPMPN
jgi:hypothetical protein